MNTLPKQLANLEDKPMAAYLYTNRQAGWRGPGMQVFAANPRSEGLSTPIGGETRWLQLSWQTAPKYPDDFARRLFGHEFPTNDDAEAFYAQTLSENGRQDPVEYHESKGILEAVITKPLIAKNRSPQTIGLFAGDSNDAAAYLVGYRLATSNNSGSILRDAFGRTGAPYGAGVVLGESEAGELTEWMQQEPMRARGFASHIIEIIRRQNDIAEGGFQTPNYELADAVSKGVLFTSHQLAPISHGTIIDLSVTASKPEIIAPKVFAHEPIAVPAVDTYKPRHAAVETSNPENMDKESALHYIQSELGKLAGLAGTFSDDPKVAGLAATLERIQKRIQQGITPTQ